MERHWMSGGWRGCTFFRASSDVSLWTRWLAQFVIKLWERLELFWIIDGWTLFLLSWYMKHFLQLLPYTHTQLIATSLLFSKVWNWIFNLVLSVVRLLVVGYFQACCIRKRSPPSVDNNAWLGWKLAAPLSVLSLSCCLNALAGLWRLFEPSLKSAVSQRERTSNLL